LSWAADRDRLDYAPAGVEFTVGSAATGHKSSRQKLVAIVFLKMRIKHAIFFGSVAALVVLAAPSLARNTEAQRTSEQPTSPSPTCQSYQLAPDGSWKQLPCREFGSGDGSQHKPSPPNVDDGEH
jgi:hypothetical protein